MNKNLSPLDQSKLLNTINKMIFDTSTIVGKDNREEFEIGVRLKDEQTQDYIYNVFKAVFPILDNDISVEKKIDDNGKFIVCLIRE